MSKLEHDAATAVFRQQKSSFDKPWFKSCIKVLKTKKLNGLKCLDLCSGNCEFSNILRNEFRMDVTCADYIPFHLKKAEDDGFETIHVNLDDDAVEVDKIADRYAGTFDLIVNLAAIEHVFNSDNLIRFAHIVLKPTGLFLINTPNISFLGYRFYSVFSGNRPFGEGHHVRFWDYRFLRTNLFMNGFEVIGDFRGFYTLPEDTLRRGFRNARVLAKVVSLAFHCCRLLQFVPFAKGVMTDELTVLCRKEETTPIGFDYIIVKNKIEDAPAEVREQILSRMRIARDRGWLKEHLYMSSLVNGYDIHKLG